MTDAPETLVRRRRRLNQGPRTIQSFSLPVADLIRFRRYCDQQSLSYSEVMTEAMRLFLASRMQNVKTDTQNGHTDTEQTG